MACIQQSTPSTIISNYFTYRQAIKVGMGNAAAEYKDAFRNQLMNKYYNSCVICNTPVVCNTGCETIENRCAPTIEEYIEVKQCLTKLCISISDVTNN